MNCTLCGNPLAWSHWHNTFWCSVYGFHRPAPKHTGRNYNAPAAQLVDELAALALPDTCKRARQKDYRR